MTFYIEHLPRSVTVCVDSREKNPLIFPSSIEVHPQGTTRRLRIFTEVRKLDAGDYALKEAPAGAGIERKASLEELCTNFCTKDWKRQRSALYRLITTYQIPYLLIEASPKQLVTQSPHTKILPSSMLTRLCSLTHPLESLPVHLLFAGSSHSVTSRLALGYLIAHILVAPLLPPMDLLPKKNSQKNSQKDPSNPLTKEPS